MRKLTGFAVVVALLLGGISIVNAFPTHLANFKLTYPNVVGTRLDSCTTCHNADMTRNAYGLDFASNGHNFGAIADNDSDGDSFANINEIQALTFPGNSADHPTSMSAPAPAPEADPGIPVPTLKLRFPYQASVYPFVSNDPLTAKPVGVGPAAEGGDYLSVQVGIGKFLSPTDLYLIYSIPGDPDKLYFMNADYSVAAYSLNEVVQAMEENRLPEGIQPWKKGIAGPVNEIILNSIPSAELETGTYGYYLLATPTGYLDRFYLWGSIVDIGMPAAAEEGGAAPEMQPLMPEPAGQDRMPYEPVMYPVISHELSTARPIGVGPVDGGGSFVSVQVGLGKFVSPMDLYIAYSLPADPDRLYFMRSDYSVAAYSVKEIVQTMADGSMPVGLEPWKKSSTGMINEIILNNIPISKISNGAYAYYLLAAPSGFMDRYYLWGSEFHVEGGTETSIDPMTPPVPSTDGIALYSRNCAVCHGNLASSTKTGRSPADIQTAINTIGHMKGLANLLALQIKAIADALSGQTQPGTLDGATLYGDYCSGCHGALASSVKTGASEARITGAIGTTTNPAMNTPALMGLSSAQISAISGVLAAATPPPPPPATADGPTLYTTYCSGCHGALASSAKAGATVARITGAIGTTMNPAMNMTTLKSLTASQIGLIAGALATATPPPPPPPPPATADGPTLYTTYCSGCHGALASSAKAGATVARITGAIGTTMNPAMNTTTLKSLTASQIGLIAGALATATPSPTISNHPSNWRQIHGNQVENSGTATCQACHGTDLRGGVGPSCYTCHGKEW